ncbi:MAG: type II toxin-antitoxin system HicA family toxin [Acidobacteriota bacterium]|nr:type II toxin-antitoxin system HicA family toxin [Acidobacteriota bacterium]
MKRSNLLQHLRKHGCLLKREGSSHSLWSNPQTGAIEAVPRHTEISNLLARKICRNLSIPEIGRERM